jgi:hypothetical protein
MRFGRTGTTLVTALLLAACAADRPSDAELERLVRAWVDAEGEDAPFEVRDFRRVDGRDAGAGRFEAQVAYTLVHLKNSEEDLERLKKEEFARTGKYLIRVSPYAKGDTRDVEGTVALERWDNGWRVVPAK